MPLCLLELSQGCCRVRIVTTCFDPHTSFLNTPLPLCCTYRIYHNLVHPPSDLIFTCSLQVTKLSQGIAPDYHYHSTYSFLLPYWTYQTFHVYFHYTHHTFLSHSRNFLGITVEVFVVWTELMVRVITVYIEGLSCLVMEKECIVELWWW